MSTAIPLIPAAFHRHAAAAAAANPSTSGIPSLPLALGEGHVSAANGGEVLLRCCCKKNWH
ncbi:MAG: hypothetical protein J0L63_10875 [Anaerolineae bacterium]|nr:hypothetical protein [Anaerolineae bacterium]